ncbi:hypothetical protein MMU07_03505 [Aquiflexum sp. LQ15W]|uniref:hypothetical protein n=1 Tax=Cognataquiflexum nitidum TaxID=2922272 RepID=UPI001F14322F|nr:hypothetical protein [Cognataquiflexum nitidum]MCH6198632.1 hypothetical protein [Cognataquiflexum nitidum]
MNIYLISDDASAVLMQPLVAYIQPFFSTSVRFHIRPYTGELKSYWTWEELFAVGHREKVGSLLPPGEHYFFFLFHGSNEFNWFGSLNPEEPNVGFLQSRGWENFGFSDPVYPLAYHLMTLVTAMKFFGRDHNLDFYHEVSRGCMFDFTEVRAEVRFKLQSAHVCPECLSKIAGNTSDRLATMDYVQRLLSLFRSVRDYMFPIDLQEYFGELDYRLVIEQDAALVLLVENHKITLPISNGKEKALFITLLKHENGLTYKDFERDSVLKEFLLVYYNYFVNQGSFDSLYRQAKQQIEDRTFRKQLEPLISRMRKKLQETLAAYPHISEALSIHSRQGTLLVPLQRKRLNDNLNKSQLRVG